MERPSDWPKGDVTSLRQNQSPHLMIPEHVFQPLGHTVWVTPSMDWLEGLQASGLIFTMIFLHLTPRSPSQNSGTFLHLWCSPLKAALQRALSEPATASEFCWPQTVTQKGSGSRDTERTRKTMVPFKLCIARRRVKDPL